MEFTISYKPDSLFYVFCYTNTVTVYYILLREYLFLLIIFPILSTTPLLDDNPLLDKQKQIFSFQFKTKFVLEILNALDTFKK